MVGHVDGAVLRFECDEAKAASNLRKHGVSFDAAYAVFDDNDRLEEDDLFSRGEYRMIAIGRAERLVITVVFAEPEENVVRLISARLATANERKAYEQNPLHP
jgi:uncharacterized DUF497 family protein